MADVHITPRVNPLSGSEYQGILKDIQASPDVLDFEWLQGGKVLRVHECIGRTNAGSMTLAGKDFYIPPTAEDFNVFLQVLNGTSSPITLYGKSKDNQRLIREFSPSQCLALARSWRMTLRQYNATPENYEEAFTLYERQTAARAKDKSYDETSIFPLLCSDLVQVGYLGRRIKLNPKTPQATVDDRFLGTEFNLTRVQVRQWSTASQRDMNTITRTIANQQGNRHYMASESVVTMYAPGLESHLRRVYADIVDLGIDVNFNSQPTKMKNDFCWLSWYQCRKIEEQITKRRGRHTTCIGGRIKIQFVRHPLRMRINFLREYAEYQFNRNDTKIHTMPSGVIREYTLSYEDFVAILTNQPRTLSFRNPGDTEEVEVKITPNLTERYYKYLHQYCTQASIDLGFTKV